MTRYAVVVALAVCGWSAGCGSTTPPDAADAAASRPQDQTKIVSESARIDSLNADVGLESGSAWHLPIPTLAYNAREGRTTFLHYCAPCHGEEGRGDGFNAYNLDPRPRDLADLEFQEERTDEDLAAIVRTGGGVAGLSNAMPPWGRTLGDRKIQNLVSFIRNLPEQVDHESTE